MKLVKFINKTFEDEAALVEYRRPTELEDPVVRLKGDTYHDKIFVAIAAYIKALEDYGIIFHINAVFVGPDEPIFQYLGFSNEREED